MICRGFITPVFFIYFCTIMNFSQQEFESLISTHTGVIAYKPLADEVDYENSTFPIKLHENKKLLQSSKIENPFVWAEKYIEYFKKDKIYILVPGTKFDIYGTRYGRGGGWYDRFLSKVPRAWLRIGVTDISRLSSERLEKKPWDQIMDFVIVREDNSWNIYKTI